MRTSHSCQDCTSPALWCPFCGACRHEKHSDECKDNWRKVIMAYGKPIDG